MTSFAGFDLNYYKAILGKVISTISDLKDSLTNQGIFVTTRGGADSLTGVVDAAVDMVFQKRMKLVGVKPNAADLFQLAQLIESGAIKPHVSNL